MGVKGLYKFLNGKYTPTPRILEDYAGKTLGIDMSQHAYMWQLSSKMSHDGKPTSILNGILNLVVEFISAGVSPVFVFDGPAPALKGKTLEARRETREFSFTAEASGDCQILLSALGVPFIVASGEADATLAALCAEEKIHAVVADDSDMLAYGASRVWRRKLSCEYSLSDILTALNLTYEQFVHVCVALGTDYGNPIVGIGPAKVLGAVSVGLDKYAKGNEWREIAALYTTRPQVAAVSALPPDHALAISFLVSRGFDENRVRRILLKL